MLDFNHRPTLSETITGLIDKSLTCQQQQQSPRHYLGGSRLGVACDRALQYEYVNTPRDSGRDFSGKTLRIFQAGHVFEALMVDWLQDAGFNIHTEKSDGSQYGFSTLDGKICGHVDGVISSGPESVEMQYPALWEAKSLNNRSWKDTVKKKLTASKPVYAAQIALYQAYMEEQIPGISQNPALFTAINKDTAEVYFELVPFNAELAQRCSDRGVKVISACEAHELLPRVSNDPTFIDCKWCAWQDRCWKGGN